MDIRKLMLLVFVLLIVYFLFLIRQDIINYQELRNSQQKAMRSLTEQQQLARALREKLALLEDKHYVEQAARERLGFVKKGETAYKILWR